MTKSIDDALGLNTLPAVIDADEDKNLPALVDSEQVQEDVDTSRDNIHNAIALSQQAVQDMLSIAQQSQHPKAYEVLNSMIKTYGDLSMGLTDLQIKKQRLNQSTNNGEEGNVTNNNLFVGSTADLLDMIEKMRNKDNGEKT